MTKSPGKPNLNQEQLYELGNDIVDNIDLFIHALNIDIRPIGKMLIGPCPVHGGDKNSAVNLYLTGETYKGNWRCNTRGCEKEFVATAIGFIRGVLSHVRHNWEFPGDEAVSFQDAVDYCTSILNKDYSLHSVTEEEVEKKKFTSLSKITGQHQLKQYEATRDDVLKSGLVIPCPYYLNRRYSPEVLVKYDVGTCLNPAKPFYKRAVVPVYDATGHFLVGCTGRSLFSECPKCQSYHEGECPAVEKRWLYSKWKHSKGFDGENTLYNFSSAKVCIKRSGIVIVVESPGNVWRIEEAEICNSVATFGTSLSSGQKRLLDGSGALSILVVGDNDAGGDTLIADVKKKCNDQYNIIGIKPNKSDVGDMSPSDVNDWLRPILQKLDVYGGYLNT
jgi:hypothetical protein